MESVLIVEDDVGLCTMLRDYLELHQLQLARCHDGLVGLKTAIGDSFDLMILDIMPPATGGFEVPRQLREKSEKSQLSILLLTSRGKDNPRELLARVRSALHRQSVLPFTRDIASAPAKFSRCGFVINRTALTAQYRSISLTLSPVELLLLRTLLEYCGIVLPREHLVERIFKRAYNPLDRSIDMLVSRLRRKLNIADNPGAFIKTVRNAGYVFAEPD
jgi:two-component system response regulator CpxR